MGSWAYYYHRHGNCGPLLLNFGNAHLLGVNFEFETQASHVNLTWLLLVCPQEDQNLSPIESISSPTYIRTILFSP